MDGGEHPSYAAGMTGGPGFYDKEGEWFDQPDYDAAQAAAQAVGGVHHPGGYYAENDEWIDDLSYGIDYGAEAAADGEGGGNALDEQDGAVWSGDEDPPGSPTSLTNTMQSFTDDAHAADRAQRYCTMQDAGLKQLMLHMDGASELGAGLVHLSCGSGNVQALEEAIREGVLATGEMGSHINGFDDAGQ